MRFGIDLPQLCPGGQYDLDGLAALCRATDESPIESVWVHESPISAVEVIAPLSMLAAAATLTRRVRLGTAVLLSPLHSPLTLARTMVSIDVLSGGRAMLGIGLGPAGAIHAAMGLVRTDRAERFDEQLAVLRQCLSGEPVTVRAARWNLEGFGIGLRPVQPGGPPILVGGGSPGALDRAARCGDGWIAAGASSTSAAAANLVVLRDLLAQHGRNPASYSMSKRVYLCVDRDRATALARLEPVLRGSYGGRDLAGTVAVVGSVEQCIDGLRHVAAAGFDRVIVGAPVDTRRHLDILASEIVPAMAGELS